jgi:hypothetical protein
VKLKFLRTPGGHPEYREGTTHEVDDDAAGAFVKAGVAEPEAAKADKPADAKPAGPKPADGKPK